MAPQEDRQKTIAFIVVCSLVGWLTGAITPPRWLPPGSYWWARYALPIAIMMIFSGMGLALREQFGEYEKAPIRPLIYLAAGGFLYFVLLASIWR